MPRYFVKSSTVATGMLLQALDTLGYNLQKSALDSNGPDVSVQTITISQYTYDKANMGYPGSAPVDYEPADQASLDTWSVVWYIASFAGLILFFLIVSCSEWCCRRNARRNCQMNSNSQSPSQAVPDTPPPSYDQFAPPSYEDLLGGTSRSRRGEKSEYDIYVVPVHALGTLMEEARRDDAPPPYHQSTNAGAVHPQELPRVHSVDSTSRIT